MRKALVQNVLIGDEMIEMELDDGRKISMPLKSFPRLFFGTDKERNNWRIVAKGEGVHWNDLDEDINVVDFVAGKPSSESKSSFSKWLRNREKK